MKRELLYTSSDEFQQFISFQISNHKMLEADKPLIISYVIFK